MKTVLIVFFILVITFIIYLFILGINSKSKDAIGLINGQLSKCPDTPNCVCSEYAAHTGHYISPITMSENTKSTSDTFLVLKALILDMGGNIQLENKNYISATFTSAIFRFIDDLEIRVDSDKNIIHLRSASRVGRGDMGVNKERIELLKQQYKNK